MVRINFSLPYPVYGPPEARIRAIWQQIKGIEPERVGARFAVVIHPETGEPRRVWRKMFLEDPAMALEKSRDV